MPFHQLLRRPFLHLLPGLVASLILGCAGSNESGDGVVVSAEAWQAQEDLRIGSVDDPDYAFTWVRTLTVSPSGRIFSVHPTEQVVRVFDPDGTLVRVMGGRGEGPGEFQNVGGAGWVGDTLWVLDYNSYRFNFFDEDGEFLDSFTVPFVMGQDPTAPQPPRASGLLSDGTIYGSPPAFSNQIEDGTITHNQLLLLTRDGEVADSVARIPFGRNQWAIYDPDNRRSGMMFTRQPYGDGPLWGYLQTEPALAILTRESPVEGGLAEARLVKQTIQGDTLLDRTLSFEAEPIPLAEGDSILDDFVERMGGRGFMADVPENRLREWGERGLYRPEFRAPVREMVLGRDGTFWLKRNTDEDGKAVWLVLDPRGKPVGQVALPDKLRVFQADENHVWGTVLDEFDVTYIVRYEFTRS